MLKEILIFTFGGAVGAGICYGLVDSKYKKQYQQDWEEMHAQTQAQIDDMERDIRKREKAAGEIAVNNLPYGGDSIVKTENPYAAEQADGITDYGAYSHIAEKENAVTAQNNGLTEQSEKAMAPFLISEEEFKDTKQSYEKNDLLFWGQDRALTDEEEDLLDPRIWDYVGDSAIAELEDTRDVVCVRNNKQAADYRIWYCDKNWVETH